MLNYLKEHSYDIFKMMMYQFMMAMIGVVMSVATHRNDTLYLATSIVYTVVYFAILYLLTYELGEKDKPAIVGGRAKLMPLKGFWMSLIANAGNIICALMIAVFSLFIVYQQPVALLDGANEPATVYNKSGEELSLYSDDGDKAKTVADQSYKYPSQILDKNGKKTAVYDSEGEELQLYTQYGESLSTEQNAIKTWASNLYGVPLALTIFLQIFYAGIRNVVFNDSIYFYLATPILPIFFSAIGYYFGATGKRLFFFLPERKRKPPKNR